MKLDNVNQPMIAEVRTSEKRPANCDWACLVGEKDWEVYHDAIRAVGKTGAHFLLGGAFGLASYTGRLRNTKDLDFFVLPWEKDKVVDSLTKAGFEDYYPQLAYDRGWIYRATRDGTIVDTIWQTPNRRTEVDGTWFQRSRTIILRNEALEIIPAEELLTIKLYVLQRDRCDWPDLLNLLYSTVGELDWAHVIHRLGAEEALLNGLLHVFNWLAPEQAREIPAEIRARFHLPD
ncbi:MAG TPA: hypothetical protein VGR78_00675, partial [Verrucomicrobiae bacterium]|nr:hypothetical protein [Verrucomicrobiae bacterium]